MNLVVVDTCRNLPHGKHFFDLLETVYVFVAGSSMHLKFIEVQKEINPSKPPKELKKISYTRWTAQVHACLSFKKLLSEVLVFLNKIISERSDRSPEAVGLLHQIDFKFVFNLCMYSYILSFFEGVSNYLQNVSSNLAEANILITSTIQSFTNSRSDEKFTEIYREVIKLCEENNIVIPTPTTTSAKRSRKIPKKYENYLITEKQDLETDLLTDKDQVKTQIFFSTIDLILSGLNNRFQKCSNVISAVSALHPNHELFLSFDAIYPLAQNYNSDIEALQSELKLLRKTIKQYELEKKFEIVNIMQLLDMLEIYKLVFQEVYKLAVISVTIPVSSAGCERTFSCLRRLKTYIRNKMTDERLSHLAIINIERVLAKTIDLSEVVSEFDAHHNSNRRIVLH